jgi:hypothetical protein
MEKFFGNATMTLAILMVFIGLLSQIKKNRADGKCGMSFWMVILPLSVYVCRVGYAATIGSWYIFVPDSFGVIFSIVILFQFFLYRKRAG